MRNLSYIFMVFLPYLVLIVSTVYFFITKERKVRIVLALIISYILFNFLFGYLVTEKFQKGDRATFFGIHTLCRPGNCLPSSCIGVGLNKSSTNGEVCIGWVTQWYLD
jgi:hypothetical protein